MMGVDMDYDGPFKRHRGDRQESDEKPKLPSLDPVPGRGGLDSSLPDPTPDPTGVPPPPPPPPQRIP